MSSTPNTETNLRELAKDAKRDISWLAAIHVVLRSPQQDIILELAKKTLINPECNLVIHNLSPAEAKRERKKAVKAFHTFGDCATEPPAEGPGHYLNKSAILYIDAILNAFLDKSYKAVRKKQINANSIDSKLKKFEECSLVSTSNLKTAKHVKFMAQLRHIITHNNGYVNDKFLDECGLKKCGNQTWKLSSNKPLLWDTQIWPDEEKFLEAYKAPDNDNQFKATLSIEGVIIPYLKHSIDFIEEFLEELLKAIKRSSGSGVP